MTHDRNKEGIFDVAPKEYVLDEFTRAFSRCVSNNWQYAIYAQNPSVSINDNEYRAGFIQAKAQTEPAIRAARNNTWRNFLIAATPQDAMSVEVAPAALEAVQKALIENYFWLYDYVTAHKDEARVDKIIRLMFRMRGIADGLYNDKPCCDAVTLELLNPAAMDPAQLRLSLGKDPVTFLDVYLVNAWMDVFDGVNLAIGLDGDIQTGGEMKSKNKSDHCTAFVHFTDDGDIIWTHNTWSCYYAQSCAVTYVIGDDFVSQNASSQGVFGSNNDFGFNGHGIGFNETTHDCYYDRARVKGLWITWRAGAAEQFAESLDDYYGYITMDNTGTSLNGYMIVDAYRNEAGLIDMSYDRFAFFRINGKDPVKVTDSTGYKPNFLDYDPHLITPTHILGVNQPVYRRIGYELMCMYSRPKRRVQLFSHIDAVQTVEDAKDLITYTAWREPLSVYGRWDVGYGTSEFLRYRPDGAQDAKAFSARMIRELLDGMSRKPSIDGSRRSFWMKFGTPYLQGEPFIWSKSIFARFKQPQSEDFVPDVLDGDWNPVDIFMA